MLGKTIRDLAYQKGMTIKDLSQKTGITEPTLHNILAKNDAKLSQIEKIAEILEVSTAFLTGTSDGSPKTELKKAELSESKNSEVVALLKGQIEEQKAMIEFFKNLVVDKLNNLERLGKRRGIAVRSAVNEAALAA